MATNLELDFASENSTCPLNFIFSQIVFQRSDFGLEFGLRKKKKEKTNETWAAWRRSGGDVPGVDAEEHHIVTPGCVPIGDPNRSICFSHPTPMRLAHAMSPPTVLSPRRRRRGARCCHLRLMHQSPTRPHCRPDASASSLLTRSQSDASASSGQS